MEQDLNLDIAVVGMAGRFPGARNVGEFWQLVREGVDATRVLTEEELISAGVPETDRRDPHYVPVWSGIDNADLFDAELFGYTPHDAALIDPQQRVFLECAWEALEDAGYDSQRFQGEIGVYAASGLNSYLLYHLVPNEELVRSAGRFAVAVGNDKDNLSTRVSYKLNLTGPSVNVQTNCSSGLVAVHQAIASLLDYQCDIAIVGAVSIKNPVPRGYLHEAGGTSSASGRIRAFDAAADGYFLGDGAGAIVLRRNQDAVDSNDRIYALIKGSAVKNDGAAKVSFAATSKSGQARAVRAALAAADVAPDTIQYVEANGSGTLMGDAIELAALQEVYGSRGAGRRCAIGAVKPNVGNLDTASGLVSLIKAVLVVHHGEMPPTIHYRQPNPQTSLANGPFFINDALRGWDPAVGPRRAGVSSFGVGGTNVHVILEQAPDRAPRPLTERWHLLTVSAVSGKALASACRRLAIHLERYPELELADVAFTCQVGRREFAERRFVVARSRAEAVGALLAVAEPSKPGRTGDASALTAALAEVEHSGEECRRLLIELGELWCTGADIDWAALHRGEQRSRVGLPGYPFQRQRFWIDPPAAGTTAARAADAHAGVLPGGRPTGVLTEFEAPNSPLEQAVAGVWRRRLGIERVGVNDSFLELGGDSLSAAQMVAEVSEAFHLDLQLRGFLESPSVATLARIVDEQLAEGRELRRLVDLAESSDEEAAR